MKQRSPRRIAFDFGNGVAIRRQSIWAWFEFLVGNQRSVRTFERDFAPVALLTANVGAGHAVDLSNFHARRGRVGIKRYT